MSRLSVFALGLSLLFTSGCCCGWPCGGHSTFYGGGGGCSPCQTCPTGGCGVGGPVVYPSGALIQPSGTSQASLEPIPVLAQAPVTYSSGYQPTAMLNVTPGF